MLALLASRRSHPTPFEVTDSETSSDDIIEIVFTSAYNEELPPGSALQIAAFTTPLPVFKLNGVALIGDFLIRSPSQGAISSRDIRLSIQLESAITLQAGDIISWDNGTFITDSQPVAGLAHPALPDLSSLFSRAFLSRNNLMASNTIPINGVSARPANADLKITFLNSNFMTLTMTAQPGLSYQFAVSETLVADSWNGSGFDLNATNLRNPQFGSDAITLYPEEEEEEITLFYPSGTPSKNFFRALP